MNGRVFFDTNIIVYGYDTGESCKQQVCRQLMEDAVLLECGVLSAQVLGEFFVVTTRKIAIPFATEEARKTVLSLVDLFHIEEISQATVGMAMDIQSSHRLSYWDSLILAAALQADCTTVYSEDLQHGLTVHGLRIENPLLPT